MRVAVWFHHEGCIPYSETLPTTPHNITYLWCYIWRDAYHTPQHHLP
jgi:hypothetical protein